MEKFEITGVVSQKQVTKVIGRCNYRVRQEETKRQLFGLYARVTVFGRSVVVCDRLLVVCGRLW